MAKRARGGSRSERTRRGGSHRRTGHDEASLDETYLKAMEEVVAEEEAAGEDEGQAGDEGKKRFGDMGTAWMSVEITDDGQEATLTELSFGGDTSIDSETLRSALQELYGIKAGTIAERIDELAQNAAANPAGSLRGRFPIASGSPAIAGEPGRVELEFLAGISTDIRPSFEPLRASFEQPALEAVLEPDLITYMAVPDEELAILVPPTAGEPGQDVFGSPAIIMGDPPKLRAGSHVRRSENGLESEIYGYVTIVDDVLSVISPIWVSPDRLEAHFVHFPQVGLPRRPQSDWLIQVLQDGDITQGIEEPSIERLCESDVEVGHKTTTLLAKGSAPVPGEDTHVDYTFDPEKQAGKVLPDGSLDLRERNAAISVQADQLLGEVVPATKGQPGTSLGGEEIQTTDGEEGTFSAGENVRTETEGDVIKFYSKIDGNVHIKGDTIQVNPVYVVQGDVNYEVGNIDVRTDVQISGSVCSGFSIKAGGTVTVNGMVESGAAVNSQGDVLIAQGVVGDTTKVVALGNVETKFIQNCAVMAKGDINVGSYIFSGHVRAGGRVVVNTGGGDRGGSIVGGEVIATGGIEAKLIGSTSTDRTLIGTGANPEDAVRMKKLREAIGFCDTSILRLMRTLGLEKMDASRIREAIDRAPAARKEFLIDAVKKLKELSDSKEKSEKTLDELQVKVEQELGKAKIEVSDKVFADVHVQMGESMVTVSEDISQPLFRMTDEGIRYRPQV